MSTDYKFGNKANWRQWLWNRIEERLPCRPRDAVVLYLAGMHDLDRAVALRHGFSPHNLIAVERDYRTLSALRKSGVLTIEGDMTTALLSWPVDRRVDVVVADFCGGMHPKIQDAIGCTSLTGKQYCGSVFAVNLMRGRDPQGTVILEQVKKLFGLSSGMALHRGLACYHQMLFDAIELLRSDGRLTGLTDAEGDTLLGNMHERCVPAWRSYRSETMQTFDTVVFKAGLNMPEDYTAGWQSERHDDAQRRRITAILAHRTMRMAA